MPPSASPARVDRQDQIRSGFAAVAGLFLGIGLLKFGNPAALDALVTPPRGYWEFVFQPWPLAWGYLLLGLILLWGVAGAAWRLPRPKWPVLLPVVWLGWQCVSATRTTDAALTAATLVYLTATVAGFYLGLLVLARAPDTRVFWLALGGCFAAVLLLGFQQRFGGLEAVRQHVQSQPGWENLPADYLRRLATNRIFATLVYPNALAGAVLLLLPPLAVALWNLESGRPRPLRLAFSGVLALAGLACLYWTKSKAGWLIAVAMGVVILLRQPLSRRVRLVVMLAAVGIGLGGFAYRFAGYFQGGAASVGARVEYWRAAWTTAVARPLTGSGPGTFSRSYRAIKPPEAEMALLAHNDYLQQASDSGFPGAIAYAGFIGVSLLTLYRRATRDAMGFAVWLGLAGWCLQGGVEFALYVPGVAWPAFWLLGLLWGRADPPHLPGGATPVKPVDRAAASA